MSTAVRLSDTLINDAKVLAKVEQRTIPGQIEYWAQIGKIAEQNPDLSFKLIKEILIGLKELESGQGIEYQFGAGKE